ncbi:kinesin light chain [Ceratobasidium sp. AG-Ba]|nr:kinesin light chain [Ceratobasidium sp. AG-Ba]
MTRLQHKLELSAQPRVRDYFDVVAGTGTGAVIACMVGRLGVSIKNAIDYYVKLAEVFADRKWVGATAYKTTKLQDALKAIVRDITGDTNTRMMDPNTDGTVCRIMVFAMSAHNMNAGLPCIFRSYQGVSNQMPDCAIWQALSASMAHPEMFKQVDIGSGELRQSFVDGGLGCNNPTSHVLAEVKAIFPDRYASSVVCIGTGHPNTIHFQQRTPFSRLMPTNVLSLTRGIALDAERVAQEMESRFRSTTGFYFRFSVGQGMQNIELSEWEKLDLVLANAQAYMRGVKVSKELTDAVVAVEGREAAVETSRIGEYGEIPAKAKNQVTGYKACPAPTSVFTGRQAIIRQITDCISNGDTQRCVFVIHGLGGAGKTQTALKAVELTRDMWTDVVFVDATSTETAESALAGFAKEKGIGESHQSAKYWLEHQCQRWLLVIDNVDNPSIDLGSLFPSGNHGSILITTRIPELAMLGRGLRPECRVGSMDEDDGLALFRKAIGVEDTVLPQDEQDAAVELLRATLAVVQAGAYIRCSQCTIRRYHDMFMRHHQSTLEKHVPVLTKIDNYQKTVYTTWHMSYVLLGTNARRLLQLMAFLHNTNIYEDTFRRAAIGLRTYKPEIPFTESETGIRSYLEICLNPYLDPSGAWDLDTFLDTTRQLLSYSLISYDRRNNTYDLHVLVQDWASTVTERPADMAKEDTALLLGLSIDYDDTIESLAYKLKVELHVSRLLERQKKPSANNARRFGEVYMASGKWKQKEQMDLIGLESCKQHLGERHEETLSRMSGLALTYQHQGRYKEAMELHEQLLEVFKEAAGVEHQFTFIEMRNLARTYYVLGRYNDARSLQSSMLDTSSRVHGHDHPNTLDSMHELALTCRAQGRHDQTETLLVKVVNVRKRVKGDEHPDTLASIDALAYTCYCMGRYDEAESMQEHVLEVRKRRQGDEHPDMLCTMNDLALTYKAKGRYSEAEELQVKVLDAWKRAYGDGHPSLLINMNNLALTYRDLGRYEEAEGLGKQVVDGEERALGAGHPRTLVSMRNLLETYKVMGERRSQEYEALREQIRELEARAP